MLDKYYNELSEKYYGTVNFVFFIFLFLCLLSTIFCLISVLLFYNFLGPVNPSIDNSVSDAIKKSGKISLTINVALPEQNIQTTIVATRFENRNGKNTTCVWSELGYLNSILVILK